MSNAVWMDKFRMFHSGERYGRVCLGYKTGNKEKRYVTSATGSYIRIDSEGFQIVSQKNGKEPMEIIGVDMV